MSFLKDFKDDLSQAVNELVDENKVDDVATEESAVEEATEEATEEFSLDLDEIDSFMNEQETTEEDLFAGEDMQVEETPELLVEENVAEESSNEETVTESFANDDFFADDGELPSDEVAEITKGTSITGNIESDGSVNLYGKIKGDIKCKGKLIVTGRITGISHAREIFANNAKIEGDVHSTGTIKVGNGSIIVGNVYATSAVIGGAIRGDIDVHGPVIVDGTAVVQGNIKSRSVQINNGAVIEGFCSQCYADIDYKSLFEDTFSEM